MKILPRQTSTVSFPLIILLCVFSETKEQNIVLRKALLSGSLGLNDVDGDNIPGRAGVDYPVHNAVPTDTNFRCKDHDFAGYFGDVETDCQAYHVCFPDGRNASFLCINGTVFHQRYFVCDWWFHFNCTHAPSLYELNLFRKIPLPVLPPIQRRPFEKPIPEPKVADLTPYTPHQEPKDLKRPIQNSDFNKNNFERPPSHPDNSKLPVPNDGAKTSQDPNDRAQRPSIPKDGVQRPREPKERVQRPRERLQRPREPKEHVQRPKEPKEHVQRPREPKEHVQRPREPKEHVQRPREPKERVQRPRGSNEEIQGPKTRNDIQRPEARNEGAQKPKAPNDEVRRPRTPNNRVERPKVPYDEVQGPRVPNDGVQKSRGYSKQNNDDCQCFCDDGRRQISRYTVT